MKAKNFDINLIIDDLRGQCMLGINDAVVQNYPDMTEDDLTQEDYSDIDNEIFLCDTCGWWCETSEQSENEDGQICEDCNNE